MHTTTTANATVVVLFVVALVLSAMTGAGFVSASTQKAAPIPLAPGQSVSGTCPTERVSVRVEPNGNFVVTCLRPLPTPTGVPPATTTTGDAN